VADIFSEVEEELRRDKYNTLLRRYGPWIAGAALAVVLGVAGYELAWEPWRAGRVSQASDSYQAALETLQAGDVDAADAQFEAVASGGHDGYAALALLQRAAIAADQGDAPRAAALYQQAADLADEAAMRAFARAKALYAIADELSYDELLDRAEPIVADGGDFAYSARELIASGALREGDIERARREYQFLNLAPETPPGVRRRAQEGLAAIARLEAAPSNSEEDAAQ